MQRSEPTYGPLVEECSRRGIGKTKAFELMNEGLLETFAIGRRRYVFIASLEQLPEKLARNGTAKNVR